MVQCSRQLIEMDNVKIVKLKGLENYATWSFMIKNVLIHEELFDFVSATKLSTDDVPKDRKALAKICLSVEPNVIPLISTAKTSKEAWDVLSNTYNNKGVVRKIALLRELYNVRAELFDDLSAYIAKITEIANLLHDIGSPVPDDFLAVIMLSGLPKAMDPIVMTLESSGTKLTTEIVSSTILQEAARSEKSSESAFVAKSKLKCYNCGGVGHFASSCKKKKKKSYGNPLRRDKPSGSSNNGGKGATSLLVAGGAFNEKWHVDSGASSHLCKSKTSLEDYCTHSVPKSVTVANNETLKCDGIGNLKINLPQGDATINDVNYVPGIGANLLSVGQTCDKGHGVVFDAKGCKILRKGFKVSGETIATGTRHNGIYELDEIQQKPLKEETLRGNAVVDANLEHKRLGHLNHRSSRILRSMVTGLNHVSNNSKFEPCESCVLGKQSRAPFVKSNVRKERSSQILGLVHSDVAGPFPPSFGGSRYFVTFIDDMTRKTFVYFCKRKSDVFSKFKDFKAEAENQTGKRILKFRSDNGGEYISNEFTRFLKDHGIIHERSCPETPTQNPVAERAMRSIVEKARTMLKEANLRDAYWAEAVLTAVYLKNRSPTKAVWNKVPEEAWSGKKVDLSHLRVFGCAAYNHVKKRRKLDSKSKRYVFVGYSDLGYRLINDATGEVFISRDVVFFEHIFPNADTIKNDSNDFLFSMSQEPSSANDRRSADSGPAVQEADHEAGQDEDDAGSSIYGDAEVRDAGADHDGDDTYIFDGATVEEPSQEEPDGPDAGEPSGRPARNIRLPERFGDYITYEAHVGYDEVIEPNTVEDALSGKDASKWKEAMKKELDCLRKNNTWKIVDLPKGKKTISAKWVLKIKRDLDGRIDRYKARLVARGFAQGRDTYGETYSPVVKHTSLRMLVALSAELHLSIDHLDVETAFLNGDIKEEIYLKPPEGLKVESGKVLKLQKSIYGLKQSGRNWNEKMNETLLEIGFKRCSAEPCLYYLREGKSIVILALYVDDCYCFHNDSVLSKRIKDALQKKFTIKDLGAATNLVGMKLSRTGKKVTLDQKSYVDQILKRFEMTDCKQISTPMEVNKKLTSSGTNENLNFPYREFVGCITYLSMCTRPDLAFVASKLGKFNDCAEREHVTAAKRVLRYLKGTKDLMLTYEPSGQPMYGYVDADWAGDSDDRKSHSGYVLKLANGAIAWESKKQSCVALSTCEAEYLAMGQCLKEILFVKQVIDEISQCFDFKLLNGPIEIYSDSTSAIQLAKNPETNSRSKHIDIKYHFVKNCVEEGIVHFKYISTNEMVADFLTKAVPKEKFCFCRDSCI